MKKITIALFFLFLPLLVLAWYHHLPASDNNAYIGTEEYHKSQDIEISVNEDIIVSFPSHTIGDFILMKGKVAKTDQDKATIVIAKEYYAKEESESDNSAYKAIMKNKIINKNGRSMTLNVPKKYLYNFDNYEKEFMKFSVYYKAKELTPGNFKSFDAEYFKLLPKANKLEILDYYSILNNKYFKASYKDKSIRQLPATFLFSKMDETDKALIEYSKNPKDKPSIDELCNIKGIGKKSAEIIFNTFNKTL